MSSIGIALALGERLPVPDGMSRAAIRWLVARTGRRLAATPAEATHAFARRMRVEPVAAVPALANAQHYEVPTGFFECVLGPQLKYSCCLFPDAATDLAMAEELALQATADNAGLADGQHILELGCGWGSLSLWMAARYPRARILSVSNSQSQRRHIERQAKLRGLANLAVVTADMNVFTTAERFDRIVSVEMFEHMSNWPALLGRVAAWLSPEGRLFIHVFAHETAPYRFDAADDRDWIARHFFTGGIMPSRDLLRDCTDRLEIESEWRWSGKHYARTARAWLANLDTNIGDVLPILTATYGADAGLWLRRWRLFFLATEGLFGFNGGRDWGVRHYRLKLSPLRREDPPSP